MNIGILLRTPFFKLVEEIHNTLAEKGYPEIRPAHGNVFQFIGKNGARITDMAKKAHMTKQSMSYLVYYLEEHGYVEQASDDTDARAIIFRLTNKGRKAVDIAEEVIKEVQMKWKKALGKDKYDELWRLLVTLNES